MLTEAQNLVNKNVDRQTYVGYFGTGYIDIRNSVSHSQSY